MVFAIHDNTKKSLLLLYFNKKITTVWLIITIPTAVNILLLHNRDFDFEAQYRSCATLAPPRIKVTNLVGCLPLLLCSSEDKDRKVLKGIIYSSYHNNKYYNHSSIHPIHIWLCWALYYCMPYFYCFCVVYSFWLSCDWCNVYCCKPRITPI